MKGEAESYRLQMTNRDKLLVISTGQPEFQLARLDSLPCHARRMPTALQRRVVWQVETLRTDHPFLKAERNSEAAPHAPDPTTGRAARRLCRRVLKRLLKCRNSLSFSF